MSKKEFDPSKAELGPLARNSYVNGDTPAGKVNFRGNNFVSSSSSGGSQDSSGYHSVISPEAEDDEPLEKDASEVERPAPIQPGDLDTPSRNQELDTDLNTHGMSDVPDPDTREMIRARLENLSMEFEDEEEGVLRRGVEDQEARRETFKSEPSDVSVDRDNLSENRSGGGFQDSRMNKLSSGSMMAEVLDDPDSNPIRLMLVLDDEWGEDWYDWEIETINQTAEADGADIHRVNEDKIMAIKILKNTEDFFDEPRVFEKVCTAFSGKQVDWGHIQEPRTHEICACIELITRYVKEEAFGDDIKAYVAAAALRDGYVLLPAVLRFASQPFSKELVSKIGDEAIEKQRKLREALDKEDPTVFDSEDSVQYIRLIKCQYHAQEKLDEVRG